MKQVVQNFRTGELMVDELPPPALKPGGVLVRTAYSLISAGTERSTVKTAHSSIVGKMLDRPDLVRQGIQTLKREGLRATLAKVKSRLNQIKALGYSASGRVIAVGRGAEEFRIGDAVACAGVGYASHAEVIFVPRNLCARVPEGASLESACYATVGAIAMHGIRQSEVRLGEVAVIIGLGLVGQLTAQMLKAAGARVIGFDIDDLACRLATESGVDATAGNEDELLDACKSLTNARGADCILITAASKSNRPIELAAELARDRARIVAVGLVGLDVPRDLFYSKELELRLSRSYGPGRYDADYEEKGMDYPVGYVRWTEKRNMEAFLQLVANGQVNTGLLTTHRYPIDQAALAYDMLVKGAPPVARTSETPNDSDGDATHRAIVKDRTHRCGVVLAYPDAQGNAYSAVAHSTTPVVRPSRAAEGAMRVSFIGAGNFARGVLLPILKSRRGLHLQGVAAATGVSAKSTCEQFGFTYSTTDWFRILDDSDTDCVVIATRHDSHAELASESLRRGKATFVEKPLSVDEVGLRRVVGSLSERSLLMVGYNRRFAPLARALREELDKRGEPVTIVYRVNAGVLPAGHWSLDEFEGGGRIVGEVCHFVDLIQYLTEAQPTRVFGASVPQSNGVRNDSCTVSIAMSDGSIGSLVYAAAGDASIGKERIEVFSGGAVGVIDDFKAGEWVRGGRRRRLGGAARDKGHAAEIESFIDAARGKSAAPITIESLLATSLTTFGIVESIRTGSAVDVNAASLMVSAR
jgi:polar amino acid transport system substrate-binding protein